MKKILVTLILFILFSVNVNAANTYFNVTKVEQGAPKCPESKLTLKVVGSDYSTGQGINFYNVYVDGKAYGQTFCMAPGKSRYVGGHTCQRTITPAKKGSNQAFDVAVTYAYQTMVNEGIIGKNPTSRSRLVGTMVFRWLEYYYGQLEAPTAAYIFKDSLDNRTNASYWRQSNQNVKDAIRISTAAKNLGNKIKNGSKTYEDLVESGKIWTDEWNFILVNTKVDGNIVTVKFDVTPKVGKAPASVKWKQFDIQCEFGFTCTVKSKKKISANKGRYVVEIDTSKGQTSKTEHQKYGMKVTTAYVDQRNPAAYVMLLNPDVGTRGHQKMFLIKDFVSSYIIQSDIPVDYPNNECLCEEKDGKFTGDYVYYETVDGKTTSTVIKKDDPKVAELQCPSECDNPEPTTCDIEYDDSGKPTYYCENGDECNQTQYHKECLHICETPDENEEHKYYCKEKVTDKGGEECSESQYLDECYCPPLKEKCEEDPNDPACDEYEEKCPNCNASVSVPGSCSDFNTNSTAGGSISDVNLTKSECNSSVNPVKRCVIDSVDQTNTSYEATTEINNNKYCKVWCDETYNFEVPTARYSVSGGYFTLSTKVSGTRNCYVSSASNPDNPIDVDGFETELGALNIDLLEYWSDWNKWNTLYQSSTVQNIPDSEANTEKHFSWSYEAYDNGNVSSKTRFTVVADATKNQIAAYRDEFLKKYQDVSKQINDNVAAFKDCTNWTNGMKFDPKIDFTYKDYSGLLNNNNGSGTFARSGSVDTTISNIYCLGDTDNHYNCTDSSKKVVANSNVLPDSILKDSALYSCDNNGCKSNTFKLSKAKWIQKTVTNTALYTPSQRFSTYHQYGTVKTGNLCSEANVSGYNNCLWTRLPDTALPVELKTGKGAFPFTLKFSNIGQSNQNGTLGRLVGSGNQKSVLTELPEDKNCGVKSGDKNGVLTQDAGYVCAYINNCPECDVTCNGDDCEIIEECEGECPVSCKNCIFDGTNTKYKYRTISLNSLFPNSCSNNSGDCREDGYNWSTLSPKAVVTRNEIETAGEDIYSSPEYSYTLTPSQMKEIRDFNKAAGTYSNTTIPSGFGNSGVNEALQCATYTDPDTGIEYSVKCLSTFLNDDSNRFFTSLKPREETSQFTLWTESEYCVTNGNCVLSREDGIGPSWK